MEEAVGSTWHRFISKKADYSFPEAKVYLDDIRHMVGIFFRALGGEGGLQIKSATDIESHARRTILQRIAGTGDKIEYASRDEEVLRLPDSIAYYPSKQLNTDLYLWLTAIAAIEIDDTNPSISKDWISRNQYRTKITLSIWPGLKGRYLKLLSAHLHQRPDPSRLPADEADQEEKIQDALQNFNKAVNLKYAKHPPQPVLLWLHPSPPLVEINNSKIPQDTDLDSAAQSKLTSKKQSKRKQAKREDMPDGNSGLMSFRLESLWSWAEYIKVDRTSTEDEDDDTMRTAEDIDKISIAQDSQTIASKIKLDLDLPSSNYDDIVLAEGIPVDEWDYKQQYLQKDHCRLQIMVSRNSEAIELPQQLRAQAHKIRRQFEALHPDRHWVSRQNEGTEFDMENYINFLADRRHGQVKSDTPVYRQLRNQNRDLSCLLLSDLSLSTDAHISNEKRVIDVMRDSLFLFSEALDATGDSFALHGFSSRNRNHIRYYIMKDFNESYNSEVRGRINEIRPNYYTRMGAAIRYATTQLSKQQNRQKLLLIVTDGKPNDLDKYEGRYGIEDTRMAINAAVKLGLRPFCVTIDRQAEDYLPYLFGSRSYVVIRKAADLPKKLPLLYLHLAGV
ncbi:MAG: VWA domain-containing protein [Gammaproteobacteria bacterium]|nr:VWA domain-containing protein [Gammaproteobacteria bacterium]